VCPPRQKSFPWKEAREQPQLVGRETVQSHDALQEVTEVSNQEAKGSLLVTVEENGRKTAGKRVLGKSTTTKRVRRYGGAPATATS